LDLLDIHGSDHGVGHIPMNAGVEAIDVDVGWVGFAPVFPKNLL
jgi:hypothetical protein